MNRPIPRRLAESRQFRPLGTVARLVARALWRRGVVQRWLSDDELLDHLQQLGIFTGAMALDFPDVFAEFTATGFLVDEGEAIVLPILSADTLRVIVAAVEPSAVELKRAHDKAFSMHLMRRARKGDPRAILARNEDNDPEKAVAAAAMVAVLEAEYRYPARARRGGNRRAVTTPEQPAEPTDGTGPVTTPGTGSFPVPRSGSLSPSGGSAASTAEPQREGNSSGPRAGAAAVTTAVVTTGTPVTDAGRRTPVPTVGDLDDAQLFEAAVDGLSLGGEKFTTGHETDLECARFVRFVRARRYSVDDLRLAGLELAETNVAEVFGFSSLGRSGVVDVAVLSMNEGQPLVGLVEGGRARERRRSHPPPEVAPPPTEFAPPVRAEPKPTTPEERARLDAFAAYFEARRRERDEGVPIDPAVEARYQAAREGTVLAAEPAQETGT